MSTTRNQNDGISVWWYMLSGLVAGSLLVMSYDLCRIADALERQSEPPAVQEEEPSE